MPSETGELCGAGKCRQSATCYIILGANGRQSCRARLCPDCFKKVCSSVDGFSAEPIEDLFVAVKGKLEMLATSARGRGVINDMTGATEAAH